jgi:hypothetical protein
MINNDESFALGGSERSVNVPPHFIQAIQLNTASLRQSRALCINSDNLVWLNGQDEGYILVDAPGGGMVTWYLCRYHGNLHFVFRSYNGNNPPIYSSRETSRGEIDELLYSYGGGIIDAEGILRSYETIAGPRPEPQYHDLFDFDLLPEPALHNLLPDQPVREERRGRTRSRSDDEQESLNPKRVSRNE